MGFKDKFNKILYAFSTEDRYADYESHNHHTRTAVFGASESRNDGIQLNDAARFDDDRDDTSGGISHSTEGVSETILAWRHIDTWTSENHSDLNASLSDPCTRADISKAEEDLSVTLPPPVKASLRIHDGQEDLDSLTGSSGLFFGLQLLSLDDIVSMTKSWRVVADKMELESKVKENERARQALISPNGSSAELNTAKSGSNISLIETKPGYGKVEVNDPIDPDLEKKISRNHATRFKTLIPGQKSIPPGTVLPVYAHPNWIPLVTDNAGNNIGVDLAPDNAGTWGQVILFGREFDTKFVLASNWGDFLLNFVKDLESGNFIILNEDDVFAGEGELAFLDKRRNVEVPYLQVLTSRAFHKWKSQQKDIPHNSNHVPQHAPKQQLQKPASKQLNASGSTLQDPETLISTIKVSKGAVAEKADDKEEVKQASDSTTTNDEPSEINIIDSLDNQTEQVKESDIVQADSIEAPNSSKTPEVKEEAEEAVVEDNEKDKDNEDEDKIDEDNEEEDNKDDNLETSNNVKDKKSKKKSKKKNKNNKNVEKAGEESLTEDFKEIAI